MAISYFDRLQTFVAVAEARSFREAAKRQGVTAPAISNAVQRLEKQLGVRLFHRSTRSLQLTAEGQQLYHRTAPLLRTIVESAAEIAEGSDVPRGTLRVSAPLAFGRAVLAPRIGTFLALFPDVTLDLSLDDRVVDLVAAGVDVAIRFGPLGDSTLMSRVLWRNRLITVASPDYLRGSPPLRTVHDLDQHRCLGFIPPWAGGGLAWQFAGKRPSATMMPPFVFTSDQIEVLVAAAIAGAGIAQVMDYALAPALADGRLEIVLPELGMPGRDVYAVWPSRRQLPAKTRVFLEWLDEAVARAG